MKKIEIRITNDAGGTEILDVTGLLKPALPELSRADFYRYNILEARETLHPGKTREEVNAFIDERLKEMDFPADEMEVKKIQKEPDSQAEPVDHLRKILAEFADFLRDEADMSYICTEWIDRFLLKKCQK